MTRADLTRTGASEIILDPVTTRTGFLRLAEDWNELLSSSGSRNVFLSWEWVSTWLNYFGDTCELHVILARLRSDNALIGIAPLAIFDRRIGHALKIRELSFLGRGTAPDHLEFIIQTGYERPVASAFLNLILGKNSAWDILRLDGLSEDSPVLSLMSGELSCHWFHQHEIICPCIRLPGDFQIWFSNLKKRRRYKIRRLWRTIESAYPNKTGIRRIENADELKSGMETLIGLHQAVRTSKNTTNAFRSSRHLDFHRRVATLFLERDWLRLYILSVGDRNIAANYCFQYRDTTSFYATGYDSEFGRYSPGLALLLYSIEKAVEERSQVYDFLRGDEPYKSLFSNDSRVDYHLQVPIGLTGHLSVRGFHFAREMIRPALKQLRGTSATRRTSPVTRATHRSLSDRRD